MKKKSKIAIFTWAEGHLSIAEAINQSIKNDYDSQVIQIEIKSASRTYMPFYRMFPSLFKVPFKLSQLDSAKKVFSVFVKQSKLNQTVWKSLAKHKPDLVISTYSMFNPILEEYHNDTNIPFYNALTDPRTISSVIPTNSALNLAFDNQAIKTCKGFNIKNKNLASTGWFVRDEYESKYKKSEIKAKLNIKKDDLTFLVCGGSEGTNAVLKIIPALMLQKIKLNIYFVCGSNKTLYQAVKGFGKIIKTTHKNLNLIPLAFTKELHKYMQAADLVIGKAGPNLLFESVATLTPFFAITHISGQEDGNLEIIKQHKLGFVQESPIKAARLLQQIINHPEKLKDFKSNLIKMKSYNQKSKQILRDLIQASVH